MTEGAKNSGRGWTKVQRSEVRLRERPKGLELSVSLPFPSGRRRRVSPPISLMTAPAPDGMRERGKEERGRVPERRGRKVGVTFTAIWLRNYH